MCDDVLGPRAERAAGGDALTDREVLDTLAERVDDADRLGAGAGRQLGLEAVGATHRPQVVVVDGREQDPHAHLAGSGLGVGDVLDGEDLGGVAESGLDECAHAASLTGACTLEP